MGEADTGTGEGDATREVITMHRHYNNGPAAVKQAREAAQEPDADRQVERMTNMMVWMAYGWIVAAGVFLRAAGWM